MTDAFMTFIDENSKFKISTVIIIHGFVSFVPVAHFIFHIFTFSNCLLHKCLQIHTMARMYFTSEI